jgi:CRISPR-associated endonuclease Cas2
MNFVICYDIGSDKARGKVLKILKDYGTPIQKSVVEIVNMGESELIWCLERLADWVKPEKGDLLRLYPMCEKCAGKIRIMGGNAAMEEQTSQVL